MKLIGCGCLLLSQILGLTGHAFGLPGIRTASQPWAAQLPIGTIVSLDPGTEFGTQQSTNTPENQTWTAKKFWEWFQSGEGQRLTGALQASQGTKNTEAAVDFGRIYHKVNSELGWEIRFSKKGPNLFQVSANGLRENIPAAKAMVQAAPAISGWKIVAFKQPSATFSLPIDKVVLTSRNVMIEYHSAPKRMFDVTVYLPVLPGRSEEDIAQNGFLLLDHVIGEYAVMTRIAGLDFKPVTSAPPEVTTLLAFSQLLTKSQ